MKKLISLIALLLPVLGSCAEKPFTIFDFNGGLVDLVSPERIKDNASPDLGNVVLDEDVGVVKRKEYIKYNSAAITGSQSVPSSYVYKKNDGTHYIIVQSSNSLWYSTGDGSFSSITGQKSSSYRYTFATCLDRVEGGNGSDNEFYWDGTTYTEWTVANSTNMVKAKLHCWWNNRLFRAGVTGYTSTLFYSNLIDPGNMGLGTNFDLISKDDGDKITGLARSPDGSYLVIFKENSIWGMFGNDPTTWQLKCLVSDVGCLYDSTIDYLNGNLVFLSKRGIESFDGASCKLLTIPIDKQIKGLWQLNSGVTEWSQTISTAMQAPIYEDNFASLWNGNYLVYPVRQSFYSSINGYCDTISLKLSQTQNETNSIYINLLDNNFNRLSESSHTITGIQTATVVSTFTPVQITANATYYIQIGPGSDGNLYITDTEGFTNYPRGSIYYLNGVGNWINYSAKDTVFMVEMATATPMSYLSASKRAANWVSWGSFLVDDYQPAGSNITYYVITATSAYNLTTNASSIVTDNSNIPQNNGDWIVVVASFTRTNIAVKPEIYGFNINWASSLGSFAPAGKTYNDSYYIAVSTDSATQRNNVVYRYNRNGIFDLWNHANIGCMIEYRGDLLFGDSTDTGQVYKANIGSTYEDSTGPYSSWYATKLMDFGMPFQDKYYKNIYITTRNTNDPINVRYHVVESTNGWVSTTYTPSGTIHTKKLNLPQSVRGKYIELKVDSTSYFNLRGLGIGFEEMPIQ